MTIKARICKEIFAAVVNQTLAVSHAESSLIRLTHYILDSKGL